MRFREAIHRRTFGDLVLQDYVNYKYSNWQIPLDSLSRLMNAERLDSLSTIEFRNLVVN